MAIRAGISTALTGLGVSQIAKRPYLYLRSGGARGLDVCGKVVDRGGCWTVGSGIPSTEGRGDFAILDGVTLTA